jgi:hypothetical protein
MGRVSSCARYKEIAAMATHPVDLETLVTRVTQLERENRFLKRFQVVAGLALLLAAAALVQLGMRGLLVGQRTLQVDKLSASVLEASNLVIRQHGDSVVAYPREGRGGLLYAHRDEVVLALLSEHGMGVELGLRRESHGNGDHAYLRLRPDQRRAGIELAAEDRADTTALLFYDGKARPRVEMNMVHSRNPSLRLRDSDGKAYFSSP